MGSWKYKQKKFKAGQTISFGVDGFKVSDVAIDADHVGDYYASWWEYGEHDDFKELKNLHEEAMKKIHKRRLKMGTREKTAFDLDTERRMENPEYRAAYMAARARIDAIDALVRRLDEARDEMGN